MRTKRLFSLERKEPTVTCNKCKYGYCVDKKRDKYYCIPPTDGTGRAWLYYGNHSCGVGEPR